MSEGATNCAPNRAATFVAEMPAEVMSLETINGEVWAVLKGGATIRVSDLIREETDGSKH